MHAPPQEAISRGRNPAGCKTQNDLTAWVEYGDSTEFRRPVRQGERDTRSLRVFTRKATPQSPNVAFGLVCQVGKADDVRHVDILRVLQEALEVRVYLMRLEVLGLPPDNARL